MTVEQTSCDQGIIHYFTFFGNVNADQNLRRVYMYLLIFSTELLFYILTATQVQTRLHRVMLTTTTLINTL